MLPPVLCLILFLRIHTATMRIPVYFVPLSVFALSLVIECIIDTMLLQDLQEQLQYQAYPALPSEQSHLEMQQP